MLPDMDLFQPNLFRVIETPEYIQEILKEHNRLETTEVPPP